MIAGEASGDMHGAALAKEILDEQNDIQLFGIGGDNMISAGVNTLYHIRDMAFLGFAEVVKHLPFILKVEKSIIEIVKREKIELAVLIDYPGFNLRLAKKLKKLGLKIIYYISPQIWAWRKGRINKIRERVDKMIVVFPFEEEMYKRGNVNVEYVGHPLIERVESYNFKTKAELYKELQLDEEKEVLLVLPGSRKHEIEKLLPVLSNASEQLASKFNMQVVIACAESIDESYLKKFVSIPNYRIVKGNTYNLFKHSKFGIIKSGTSTLEAAIFALPFIAVYSTSKFTYEMAKRLIKVQNIAMPNIIMGNEVVKEFIQDDVNPDAIVNYCENLLNDSNKIDELVSNLIQVKNKLGGIGASQNAAKIILKELHDV